MVGGCRNLPAAALLLTLRPAGLWVSAKCLLGMPHGCSTPWTCLAPSVLPSSLAALPAVMPAPLPPLLQCPPLHSLPPLPQITCADGPGVCKTDSAGKPLSVLVMISDE